MSTGTARHRHKTPHKKQSNKGSREKETEGASFKSSNNNHHVLNIFIVLVLATVGIWLISTKRELISSIITTSKQPNDPTDPLPKKARENKQESLVDIKNITNKYDQKLTKELSKAERLLNHGNVDKALQEFSFLVTEHPESPRARYGKAQALDASAEKQRSNSLLLEAISVHKEVAEIKNCPAELRKLALKRAANRLHFLGRYNQAIGVLEQLSFYFPSDAEIKNDIGIQYLFGSDHNKALGAFQQALKLSPTNGCAKSHIGFILKIQEKFNESIAYLEEGLRSGHPRSEQGNFYYHLGDAYQRLGNRKEAYRVYETGVQRGYLLSAEQRSLYNADTKLKAQPWWTAKESGYAKDFRKLEAKWKIIRDEAVGLLGKAGRFENEAEGLQNTGDWKQMTLYSRGEMKASGCHRAPKTCKIIQSMTSAVSCKRGQIKFSVIYPGTHVWPHTGPTNCRLRAHLGLIIPEGVYIKAGNEIRTWEEGKVLVFDDSFEHEVWHNGTSYRLILIIDFWHPELTAKQRAKLSPI